jgi:tRNA-2-methylthio-N6-dimethylallyladenosine synthase
MKRGYTALEYRAIIRKLRGIRPDLLVSSDFIVGFPGETDADFDAMMRFIDDVGFDNSFSFLYSPRPGTPAAALPMDIPLEVRKERLQRLQTRIDEHTRRYNNAMVGTTQRVLVEGYSQKNPGEMQGRTDGNRVVHIAPSDKAPLSIGEFADIAITDATNYALRGVSALVATIKPV